MQVTYSSTADAAYIRLTGRRTGQVKGHEVAPGVILDLDDAGEAVGLELLGLRARSLGVGEVMVHLEREAPIREQPDERRLRLALEAKRKATA